MYIPQKGKSTVPAPAEVVVALADDLGWTIESERTLSGVGLDQERFWRLVKDFVRNGPVWVVMPEAAAAMERLQAAAYVGDCQEFMMDKGGKFILSLALPEGKAVILDIRNFGYLSQEWTMSGLRRAWQRVADIGAPFGYTLSSIAFNHWRAYHMPARSVHIASKPGYKEFEGKAYYGGRAEVYRPGVYNGLVYALDHASMYADVMRGMDYPTVPMTTYSRPGSCPPDLIKAHIAAGGGAIAAVNVRTDPAENDFAPYPRRTDDGISYPWGEFLTVLATPELTHALYHDAILGVGRVHLYIQDSRLFDSYIDLWWERKNAGHHPLAKEMLVALSGRFATQVDHWRPCEADDHSICHLYQGERRIIDEDTGEIFTADYPEQRYVLGQCQRLESKGYHRLAAPRISAQIASYARLKLLAVLERAGAENVLYCDTDGLLVTERGYNRLAPVFDGVKLGGLRTEAIGNRLDLRGVKSYTLYQDGRAVKENHSGVVRYA